MAPQGRHAPQLCLGPAWEHEHFTPKPPPSFLAEHHLDTAACPTSPLHTNIRPHSHTHAHIHPPSGCELSSTCAEHFVYQHRIHTGLRAGGSTAGRICACGSIGQPPTGALRGPGPDLAESVAQRPRQRLGRNGPAAFAVLNMLADVAAESSAASRRLFHRPASHNHPAKLCRAWHTTQARQFWQALMSLVAISSALAAQRPSSLSDGPPLATSAHQTTSPVDCRHQLQAARLCPARSMGTACMACCV